MNKFLTLCLTSATLASSSFNAVAVCPPVKSMNRVFDEAHNTLKRNVSNEIGNVQGILYWTQEWQTDLPIPELITMQENTKGKDLTCIYKDIFGKDAFTLKGILK